MTLKTKRTIPQTAQKMLQIESLSATVRTGVQANPISPWAFLYVKDSQKGAQRFDQSSTRSTVPPAHRVGAGRASSRDFLLMLT
jgi:hypothetical protein